MKAYARWISRWEARLANADQNRTACPFEWGLDWLGLEAAGDPAGSLEAYGLAQIANSGRFFSSQPRNDYRLENGVLRFTSPLETAYPENNTVHAAYFPAARHRGRAVLVIPQWNAPFTSHWSLCRLLQRLGISALRLSKAYHHDRKPAGLKRAEFHVSANLGRTIHATRQSVVDARCALDWLSSSGYSRLGLLGTSLGSCIALLAAAHDQRIKAGVFNHISLEFGDVVWTGVSCRHVRQSLEPWITQDRLRKLWRLISPSAYLGLLANRPMNSLLIWGSFDTTFRPEYSRQVLEAFSRLRLPHRSACLPCGHYTMAKPPFVWMDAWLMCRFLLSSL